MDRQTAHFTAGTIRFAHTKKGGRGGALAEPLRSGRRFLCANLTDRSASDFNPRRNRSDEFHDLQSCDVARLSRILWAIGISGSASLSRGAPTSSKSGSLGAFRQIAIGLDHLTGYRFRRPLPFGNASQRGTTELARWG